jgi:hypothetical protein
MRAMGGGEKDRGREERKGEKRERWRERDS